MGGTGRKEGKKAREEKEKKGRRNKDSITKFRHKMFTTMRSKVLLREVSLNELIVRQGKDRGKYIDKDNILVSQYTVLD